MESFPRSDNFIVLVLWRRLNHPPTFSVFLSPCEHSALPADGPKIKGGRPRYQLGEPVRVNCTSGGYSRPPTKLTWFINGEPASPAYLREYEPIVNARGLVLTRLGLEFTARQRHFQKGDLKLKVRKSSKCGKLLNCPTNKWPLFSSVWPP